MDALGMDEAYLRVYNDDDSPNESAYLYGRSDNCDKCPFESYGVVGITYVQRLSIEFSKVRRMKWRNVSPHG